MTMKIMLKKDINNLLKEVSGEWNVYAPQKNLGGDIWLDMLPKSGKELDDALKNMVLEDVDTISSAKEIFFPQMETMIEFNNGRLNETTETSAKLLFGIRSCDLNAITFTDAFFSRNLGDRYYASRIETRFIVVIGCLKPPRKNCFCTSTQTGPFAEDGFDLQLADKEDSYLVEIGSKKGEDFILKYKKYFKDCPSNYESLISEIKSKSSKNIELNVDFKKCINLMAKNDFIPEENYKRIGERCIYCGACLYVCPTCTCFNVFDNGNEQEGRRLRNWDGCVFEGYTRETSGHNPRKEKWQRTSRRYEHKLKYDYLLTGKSGCVGCGRCLSSCPVDIGISKFIQEITENKKVL